MNQNQLAESTEFFMLGLSMLEQSNKTNIIPELMQLFTPRQIIALTQIYGGKSIKVPSSQELAITLKASLFLYQTKFQGLPEQAVRDSLEVSDAEFKTILDYVNKWQAQVCDQPGASLYSVVKGN